MNKGPPLIGGGPFSFGADFAANPWGFVGAKRHWNGYWRRFHHGRRCLDRSAEPRRRAL